MDATIEPSEGTQLTAGGWPSRVGEATPLHSRILGAVLRSLLCGWILIEIIVGLLLLPYARLFFYGLERLATDFPGSQRWPLFSQARARYERWSVWRRRRSWQFRAVLFVLTIGTAVLMWWRFA